MKLMSHPTRIVRALLTVSANHPWLIIAIVFAVSLILIPFIPRVRLQLDARSLVPDGHQDLAASDRASALFSSRDKVVVAVANKTSNIYNLKTLSTIDRVSKGLSGIEGIVPSSVTSITTVPMISVSDDKIDMRLLCLDACGNVDQEIERARQYINSMALNDGVLVSRDNSAALILAQIKPEADRALVFEQIKQFTKKESVGDDSIYLSGTALAKAVLGEASAKDLLRLVPLTILLLAIVLSVGFRHPAPALISLLEIGVSLTWTIGVIGLTGRSVFVTTLVMPVILISVGVSDDVYVLNHYLRAKTSGSAELVETFSAMIHPVGITAITTIVGLLSLAATNLEPFRVFGLFGALAILCSTLLTFTLVPALLVLLGPYLSLTSRSQREGVRLPQLGSFLFQTVIAAGPWRLLALVLVVTVVAILVTTQLRVDDSWIKNLPADNEISQGDRAINEKLGGTTTIDLMVADEQKAVRLEPPSVLSLLSLEDRLATVSYVGATYGAHQDILRLNAALKQLNYADYRARILRGDATLSQDEIEQAILLLTAGKQSRDVSNMDTDYHHSRLTVFIRSANYERIDDVLQTVCGTTNFAACANNEIVPFGDGWISHTTVRLLVKGQMTSIVLALLVDLVLLTVLLKSLRLSLTAILPVAFSVLIVLALLVLMRIPLGIANSMFASIAIGIGLDFAIHLTATFKQAHSEGLTTQMAMREALGITAPAIFTSATAITLGFSVLTLSQIMPNRQLGLMICMGLALCAAATLVLVPVITLASHAKR